MTSQAPESRSESLPVLDRIDPYMDWAKAQGVPIVEGYYVEDMASLELAPWPRKGGRGAILNLDKTNAKDAHVVELAPGGTSEPEHHLYEEIVYVLSGRGATSIWHEGGHKQTFEWAEGSLFAIPLNAWYQHFNSSSEPARYIAVTNLPPTLRQYHNADFVFNCPFAFTDRFGGEEESYFSGQGTLYQERIWETGFVPDARSLKVYEWRERGGGGSQVRLQLAEASVNAHISQFQVGTYKKAHRHGPGAHLLIIAGKGFSLFWEGDAKEWQKVDWKPGTLEVVPYTDCLHQHLNSGSTPARYLAILAGTGGGRKYGVRRRVHSSDVSLEDGGNQLEYELEDPAVHRLFEAELAANGVTCRMKALVPSCTGEVGPTDAGEWGDG